MNVKTLRAELSALLKKSNINEFDANLILIFTHVLKITKTQLVLGEREITPEEEKSIRNCVKRLINGEPVHYITGRCEFMSLDFITKPGVLIPRADTEVLVDAVMQRLDSKKHISITDLCCGSGCIGISLAYYMPNISVTCIDVSNTALDIAKKNADLNNVSDRIKFLNMDITQHMPEFCSDCIVSNPPYIKTEVISTLSPAVKNNEPLIALDGGSDGLDFYRIIAENAKLKKGGLLAFEIGYDQGDDVINILKQNGYADIELLQDIENRNRVVLGRTLS